jgi:hypothetical protein
MTKLAANPNFGRPSHRKLSARLKSWQRWGQLMAMARAIRAEVEPIIEAQRNALDNLTCPE